MHEQQAGLLSFTFCLRYLPNFNEVIYQARERRKEKADAVRGGELAKVVISIVFLDLAVSRSEKRDEQCKG